MFEQACIAIPGNRALLAGWGRALADNGNFQQAFDVLSRAHSPDNPDWRILSVQGTCLDQLGRHDEARGYYTSALNIVPGEPSVLSNLGLSYMLTRELPRAEDVLRQAYANPKADARVRQNLGLVVGLQGRFCLWPSRSSRPTCRRTSPPPMSPIWEKRWAERGQKGQGHLLVRPAGPRLVEATSNRIAGGGGGGGGGGGARSICPDTLDPFSTLGG